MKALERLGHGAFIQNAVGQLRGVDDTPADRVGRLCHAIGPAMIAPLAELLAAEQDARARHRLRDILVGFGPSGREAIQQLLDAPNWEVRRTAAFLLREFGGSESLSALEPLLRDPEPLVQREAIQGLVMAGSEAAYALVAQVIASSAARVQGTLVRELTALRDERATPLFCYLVRHIDRRAQRSVFESALDALGLYGGPEAVEALEWAIQQGDWWAPMRTRASKRKAAAALRRIGAPDAIQALRTAAAEGSRSTRAAARAVLGDLAGG